MTTRADMARHLSLSPSAPTKTFVLDVHTRDSRAYLDDLAGRQAVESTADAYLFRLHLREGSFWVDQLDERFWSFHTEMPMREAGRFLHERVETRRDLDWMWLPSEHLRHLWPGAVSRRVRTDFQGHGFLGAAAAAQDLKVHLSGRDAEALLDYISQDDHYRPAVSFDSVEVRLADTDLGSLNEGVSRMGRFAVSGDALEFHLQFVRAVVERYRRLVALFEQNAISWRLFDEQEHEGGGVIEGGPIVIQFSRPVEDLSTFLYGLFAARRPFRLWGTPQVVDEVAHVEAVDLHVGQRLRMEVGEFFLRVYLEAGSCGNTVARLVSNLQHRFDGALTLLDADLQAAMTAQAPSADKTGSPA